MEIADKLTQIANNVPLVYEAGYEKGKSEGGDNPLLYATTLQGLFQAAVFPTDYDLLIEVNSLRAVSNRTNIATFAYQSQNLRSAKLINNGDKTASLVADNMFRTCSKLEYVDLTEFNRKFSTITYFIADSTKVKAIYGELDLSAVTTYTYWLANVSSLVEMRIKADTITASITFQWCPYLSDDTIQSIIDGLMAITDGVARTITFHQAVRNKLSAEQENEIQNVKGWTLSPATKT